MGYFSNGTEGEIYEHNFCRRCVHAQGEHGPYGCAVWQAHMQFNYAHCNDEESILHILIPRSEDKLENEQCAMFHEAPTSA